MIKVKQELLTRINDAKSKIQNAQMELGAIALQELRKNGLLQEAVNAQNEINEALKDIHLIYGDGEVNPETGEFHPKQSELNGQG